MGVNLKVPHTLSEKIRYLYKKNKYLIFLLVTAFGIFIYIQFYYLTGLHDTRGKAETPTDSPQRFVSLFQQGSDLSLAGKRYSFFILNEWNAGRISTIKAANPNAKVLLYKNSAYLRVSDNQSSVSGFQYVWDNHQDWFVKDANGNNVYIDYYNNGDKWYYMDWGNPDWQKYWADKTIASIKNASWDGVFADDIYVSLSSKLKDQALSTYKTDEDVQRANRAFLAYQTNRMHTEGNYLATYNVSSELMWYPNLWADWLTVSDGLMEEHFMHVGTTATTGFTSIEDSGSTGNWWLRRIQMVSDSEKLNKNSMFICHTGDNPPQIGSANYDVMMYCYVSYLLGAKESTLFFTATGGSYNNASWFSLWEKDLGLPLGDYQLTSDNVYYRNFTNGKAIVNPSKNNTRTFSLGEEYTDENGTSLPTTITLTPHKAIVAFKKSSPSPTTQVLSPTPTIILNQTVTSTPVPTLTNTPTPKPTSTPTPTPTKIPTPTPTISKSYGITVMAIDTKRYRILSCDTTANLNDFSGKTSYTKKTSIPFSVALTAPSKCQGRDFASWSNGSTSRSTTAADLTADNGETVYTIYYR